MRLNILDYETRFTFDGSLEEVLTLAKDRTKDTRVYPNITSVKQVLWEETDSHIHVEFIVRGDGEIPEPLRNFISERMLSWREIGTWNKRTNTYQYKVRTFYFSSLFHMTGTLTFSPLCDDCVEMVLRGCIRVDVPVFGAIAEKTIVRYQLANLEKEVEAFQENVLGLRRRSLPRADAGHG